MCVACITQVWLLHCQEVPPDTVLVPLWLFNTLPPFPDLYFPVGQSTANPKSLPASPWRRASVEQMASVCRAAIKEGATSGEKKVGQDRGGWKQGRQREAASASGLRADVCICSHAHTVHASVHCFPGLPSKNKYPPHASHKASAVWEWKEGEARSKLPPESGRRNFLQELHGQIPQPNQWD